MTTIISFTIDRAPDTQEFMGTHSLPLLNVFIYEQEKELGKLISITPIMGATPHNSMSTRLPGELYIRAYLCAFRK